MLATIRDDTWNVLNMQHIIPNSKRWDYSDIPSVAKKRLKDPPTWLKVATTIEKPPTPTQPGQLQKILNCLKPAKGWINRVYIVVSTL